MTKEVKFLDWVVEVDFDMTSQVYQRETPERCGCLDCQNFFAVREGAFPQQFLHFLEEVGIDHLKESELCHYYRDERKLHYYGGWYHFKGKIVSGPNGSVPMDENGRVLLTEDIEPDFSVCLSPGYSLHIFPSEVADDLIQVDFFAYLPWKLDAPDSWDEE